MSASPVVYFIDDSATMREVIKIAFRRENINVITCHDPGSALTLMDQTAPDVVISDVIMPEKDGYEVCQYIKQHPALSQTPVILMSGVVNRSVAERAFAVKADELIRKPFQPQDLITRVRHLLHGKDVPKPPAPPPTSVATMAALSSIFQTPATCPYPRPSLAVVPRPAPESPAEAAVPLAEVIPPAVSVAESMAAASPAAPVSETPLAGEPATPAMPAIASFFPAEASAAPAVPADEPLAEVCSAIGSGTHTPDLVPVSAAVAPSADVAAPPADVTTIAAEVPAVVSVPRAVAPHPSSEAPVAAAEPVVPAAIAAPGIPPAAAKPAAQPAAAVQPEVAERKARVPEPPGRQPVMRTRLEIMRLQSQIKKLEAELAAEREYSHALEEHIKTLQEVD